MFLSVTVERVLNKILGGDGHLDKSLRETVFRFAKSSADTVLPQTDITPALAPFVEKVTNHRYKVIDRDIE